MKMRKVLLFLLMVVVTVTCTACSIRNISSDDYIKNIETIVSRTSKYTNTNAIGYQYYLPNGVTVAEVSDYNQRLYSHGENYYLYADIVSYYHNVYSPYKENEDAFISEKIEKDGIQGYVEVNESDGRYFIEMMFNYAKVESLVKKENLKDALNNITYILTSIKYNDDIVENLLGEEKYNLSDGETYNIFKTKKTTNDNFLKYDDEYGKYDGDEAFDLIEKKEIDQNKDN